jgi:hypothetical protein
MIVGYISHTKLNFHFQTFDPYSTLCWSQNYTRYDHMFEHLSHTMNLKETIISLFFYVSVFAYTFHMEYF